MSSQQITLTLDDIKTLKDRAAQAGTLIHWADIAIQWMDAAQAKIDDMQEEINKLQENKNETL